MRFNRKNGNRRWLRPAGLVLRVGCVSVLLSLFGQAAIGQRKKPVRRSSPQIAQASSVSPQKTLALGMYYYNNDDISGKAEQQFKLLIERNANTEEAESAQYFLASYYQRKFYIQRAKWRKDDVDALNAAEQEYQRYTEKYTNNGQAKWLADSLFNLALIHLQKGDSQGALQDLSRMNESSARDPSVYIYELVWSSDSRDVIDSSVQTALLAKYMTNLLAGNSSSNFDQQIEKIKSWFHGMKVKSAY